jgi:hypothetical protein
MLISIFDGLVKEWLPACLASVKPSVQTPAPSKQK